MILPRLSSTERTLSDERHRGAVRGSGRRNSVVGTAVYRPMARKSPKSRSAPPLRSLTGRPLCACASCSPSPHPEPFIYTSWLDRSFVTATTLSSLSLRISRLYDQVMASKRTALVWTRLSLYGKESRQVEIRKQPHSHIGLCSTL